MKRVQKVIQSMGGAAAALALSAQQAMAQNTINLLGEGQTVDKPAGFADNLGTVFNSVLSFIMVIAALLVFMYLIWGGIEWITSGGDKGQTEKARNKITAAVIGLIILAAAYAIFLLVLRFLGFPTIESVFNVRPIGG